MDTQKRLLLATALSFLVFVVWALVFKPSEPVSSGVPSSIVSNDRGGSSSPVLQNRVDSGFPVGGVSSKGEVQVVETPLYKVSLNRLGGWMSSFNLKSFHDRALVVAGEEAGFLLRCESCNFTLPPSIPFVQKSSSSQEVVYEWSSPELLLRKIYRFSEDKYLIDLKLEVLARKAQGVSGRLGIAWVGAELPSPNSGGPFGFLKTPPDLKQVVYLSGGNVIRKVPSKEESKGADSGLIAWAGLEDRYFLRALITRELTQEQSLTYRLNQGTSELVFYTPSFSIPSSHRQVFQFSAFVGPKRLELLKELGVGLEKTIDYGMLSVLALPILYLLKFFHNFVANWGVCIILLTLFVKALLNPLTLKGLHQMKAMQKLQPELAALREKFAGDKQRLNTETMNLFKRHKVNPVGGCLPMLLQMPIYIALYKVLYNSIELYQTPFFGFYKDLSAPDPYFILPVILGLFMFLQQKLTPNPSADPSQARIMMFMPIMFTAFMLFLPVGLVVYILVNTVMSVLQQWMHQKGILWRDLFRGRFNPRTA
ncbi:MAG: membrane protein insertase YidC [Deltaproteobacteria bacterium]|nr:membrane protein insertase YidC [Deltaproteobacteria bacterium]